MKKLFAEISKTEELDDGTIKVWGYASSDAVDSDGETVTSEAMKAALPDYMKFGAVREMHQAKAAGTAIEASIDEEGRTFFGAHVVDTEAVKKVKANVYKGFSIGGKVTERDELNKTIIKGIKLVEVSLVDRPANPEAVFTMYKADSIEEPTPEVSAVDELAEMLNKGEIDAKKLLELAKSSKTEEVKKSMWSVQDFASILQMLGWICQDSESEAQYEGDSSPIPAQLRAWFATGMQIFQDMATEELNEMMANLKTQAGDVDVLEMSAKSLGLSKKGAKFSKDAKDKLDKAKAAMNDAANHIDSTGYAGDDDGDEDKSKAELSDTLTKVSTLETTLNKVEAENAELKKRVTELESKPAPSKALLKGVVKGDEVELTDVKNEVVVKDDKGSINEVASEIKKLHQSGGVRAS